MALTYATMVVAGSSLESRRKLCAKMGKKAESEGVEIFHASGRIQSILNPSTHPEKINHLAKAVTLATCSILMLPELGDISLAEAEAAIAIDAAGLSNGQFVSRPGLYQKEVLQEKFAGLSAANFGLAELTDFADIAAKMDFCEPQHSLVKEATLISIDNAFTVKGVGMVALGYVVSGQVSVHETLRTTEGKESEIRSIQVMDVSVDSAQAGSRVGLALRGLGEKDLEGALLAPANLKTSTKLGVRFRKAPFYKHDLLTSKGLSIAVAGQLIPCTVVEVQDSMLALECSVPLPTEKMRGMLVNPSLPQGSQRVAAALTW